MVDKRICTTCGEEFPATREFFYINKKAKYGLDSRCIKCKKLYSKMINASKHGREMTRKHSLKNKFGITLRGYGILRRLQNNKCAICGREETGMNTNGSLKRLSIDHNHKTGKIRELLCQTCNTMLRRDNPFILIKGAKYLKKYKRGK